MKLLPASLPTRGLAATAPLVVATLLSAPLSAQDLLTGWNGAAVEATLGSWHAATPAGGSLLLTPTSPATDSTVRLRLPASTNSGVPSEVTVDLAPIDPTGVLLAPGAELSFQARGPLGGLPDQPIGTLTMRKVVGGHVEYSYDGGNTGPTTYTIEFWNGAVLEHVATGVGGPLFLPNCDAHPWCCWTGQVIYVGGHWINGWACAIPIDWQGQIYNTNRVVVIPENPVTSPSDPSSMEISARGHSSLELTGLTLNGLASPGTVYCAGVPNSTGQPGGLLALGTNAALANDLELVAHHLPANQFGLFVVSANQAFLPGIGGSQGTLCLGAGIGRYNAQLANSGPHGVATLAVDLAHVPQGSGFVATVPGATWNFQLWHRDANPTATSNFTEAVTVTF